MKKIILFLGMLFFLVLPVAAEKPLDSDGDAVPDKDEINIYGTDPFNKDTDGDGYSDWIELNNGYSPLDSRPLKLEETDYDGDGLSDRMELNFGSNLKNPDTDGDGYGDGEEVAHAFDPTDPSPDARLAKKIEIDTVRQELSYFLSDVRMDTFRVSSGVNNSTPKGGFAVINKNPKAWSSYGLWMPYWLGLGTGKFGIHELPIWPNGYREGESHLGIPVSHGCIRLGIGPAEFIYNWAEVGTPVIIY